jgi:intracellular sulfur oxidation DsrE/DsrF family protein
MSLSRVESGPRAVASRSSVKTFSTIFFHEARNATISSIGNRQSGGGRCYFPGRDHWPGAGSSADAACCSGFRCTPTAPRTAERPSKSLRYKVPFSVTQGNDDTTKPNASLDKVARFMNPLASDGIRPVRGDVVAVMHGKATPIVMDNAAYRASNNAAANPNLELIEQLKKAGVSVRVCSQALAAASIAPEAVDKRVEIDVAALTTIATLQLRRYALSPD